MQDGTLAKKSEKARKKIEPNINDVEQCNFSVEPVEKPTGTVQSNIINVEQYSSSVDPAL